MNKYITFDVVCKELGLNEHQLQKLIGMNLFKPKIHNNVQYLSRKDIDIVYNYLQDDNVEPENQERLGDILIRKGLITKEDLETAIGKGRDGDMLGDVLINLGYLTEDEVIKSIQEQQDVEYVNLDKIHEVEKSALAKIPLVIAESYKVFPVEFDSKSNTVKLASSHPEDTGLVESISFLADCNITPVISTPTQIRNAIKRFYNRKEPKFLSVAPTPSGRYKISEYQDKALARKLRVNVEKWYADDLEGPRVFIGMPFHEDFDPVAEVILSAVDCMNGTSLRIDQVQNLRNIWLAIEQEISRCDIMIADFTGDKLIEIPNPNVVTEATIALHKYAKPVIVITQSTSGLFFDWRHQFAVVYNNSRSGLDNLHKNLLARMTAEINHKIMDYSSSSNSNK